MHILNVFTTLCSDCTKLTLKSDEVAEILKISRAMAYKLMQRGEIPTIRIGSAVRVRVEDLEKYVAQKAEQNVPFYGEKLRKI